MINVLQGSSQIMDPSFEKTCSSFRRYASKFLVLRRRFRHAELVSASISQIVVPPNLVFQRLQSFFWLLVLQIGTCILQLLFSMHRVISKAKIGSFHAKRALQPGVVFGSLASVDVAQRNPTKAVKRPRRFFRSLFCLLVQKRQHHFPGRFSGHHFLAQASLASCRRKPCVRHGFFTDLSGKACSLSSLVQAM